MKSNFVKIATTGLLFATISFTACQKDASLAPSISASQNALNETPSVSLAANGYGNTAFMLVSNNQGGSDVYNYDMNTQAKTYEFPILGVCDTLRPIGDGKVGCTLISGLAYDNIGDQYYAVSAQTARTAQNSNRLLTLNNRGIATRNLPLLDAQTQLAITDVSDIERDPSVGKYYAIRNKNQVVQIDINTGLVSKLSPQATTFSKPIQGLTVSKGRIIVLEIASATLGKLYMIDKNTGILLATRSFPLQLHGDYGYDWGITDDSDNCPVGYTKIRIGSTYYNGALYYGGTLYFKDADGSTSDVSLGFNQNIAVRDFAR